MYKLTKLVAFREGTSQAERASLIEGLRKASQANQVKRFLLEPQSTEGMSVNAGDYIWHLQFSDHKTAQDWSRSVESLLANPIVGRVETAGYEGEPSGSLGKVNRPDLNRGVYRTLLLRVDDHATPEQIAGFEADMRAMPVYIDSIKNWQFTRVSEASGSRKWTHVWEQEYVDLDGLNGPYVMHPHHWAQVDRWYQPDSPDQIVADFLCHTFCNFSGSSLLNPKAA